LIRIKRNISKSQNLSSKKEKNDNMSDDEKDMHMCPNCGAKVPDWEWDEGEGMCDTCVAEDTHVAMGL